jgi:hypothetical protein
MSLASGASVKYHTGHLPEDSACSMSHIYRMVVTPEALSKLKMQKSLKF